MPGGAPQLFFRGQDLAIVIGMSPPTARPEGCEALSRGVYASGGTKVGTFALNGDLHYATKCAAGTVPRGMSPPTARLEEGTARLDHVRRSFMRRLERFVRAAHLKNQ